MATLSRKIQSAIKAYRMWAVIAAEDSMRMRHELRMQDALELHNHHVWAKHNDNRRICLNAQAEYAKESGLDH